MLRGIAFDVMENLLDRITLSLNNADIACRDKELLYMMKTMAASPNLSLIAK